ncbi:MAG TPA: NAD-glutamate dehydrogenase, partial [Rhodospirillaceae bacterium]|nr:NAD-glutamate dehydrogenase [Rhodospirillaceae bacterium]
MTQRIDQLKADLVEKVVGFARQRLDSGPAQSAERLLRRYYINVAPEDMAHSDAETLYGAGMALFAFSRQRTPGQPKVRLYQPRADEHGWDCPHSVIEVVFDDSPFLVDSVSALLQARDITIHLLVHPVLRVTRDEAGNRVDLDEGGPNESFMHIEIDRQPAGPNIGALVDEIIGVLTDVRLAVNDWKPVRQKVEAVIAEIDSLPEKGDPEERAETRAFLQWIHDDNFTLLGYGLFRFEETGPKSKKESAITLDESSSLGLMRQTSRPLFDTEHGPMPPELQVFLSRPYLLMLVKADRLSTVHRRTGLDIVGIKRFDQSGKVIGMHAVIGLFTHSAYTLSPLMIPMLRRKVHQILERAGFAANSHDGKALLAILENYPRDELLQTSKDALFETALGILRLQERQRVAVFLRKEEFNRFFSALVFVPRDRYDTRLRQEIQDILQEVCQGRIGNWYTQLGDSPLARLHCLVRTDPRQIPEVDLGALESRLADAARSWNDRLQEALIDAHGEDQGLTLYRRWGRSFPAAYRETTSPRSALFDVEHIEAARDGLGLHLYRPLESPENEIRFKVYRALQPVALSDVLPLFEHMGFRVISEVPHQLSAADGSALWIHDFIMTNVDGSSISVEAIRTSFEDAFRALWQNEAEDDGFNRLIINGGLKWRQVMVLRAYAKYLRQAGSTFSQTYVERSVAGNPHVAALLVRLFEARFDPAGPSAGTDISVAIDKALEAVVSADEDRILRRFLNLIDATLRTNYFQRTGDGEPKRYLSLKLDSKRVDGLPLPRPMVEIFVYSPRMEGIHLRGGKVARGGIRWSDRPEDFRTEILGLMKAQMVKNAVIVPVGSKGGFVVKQPPKTGGREAFMEEGIACYKTLMRGLLDLTDNLAGGKVAAPPLVVRRDDDDPYLVVAADKGTATFSDIANSVSAEYGFWVGDGFASGGSQGYDHKAMGITAKGAWESVKRHFREMGRDTQSQDFTVIGVGDMSGDVFGNGMLRSPHIRLLAAFDHRHIFVDPDPEPTAALAERQRLFALPRSSWADYDAKLLSKGGGIFPREAKQIHLSPEIRERFEIEMESLAPTELIRILLTQPVDLLWFGGIGTYVKASSESNAEVGDRANEGLRVDGGQLRCKVVGEGANLGFTQRGRIEAALAGVRLNTDAIDNSAGVDCSDHEVNIKILVDAALADGDLTVKQRNLLLVGMTEEVGKLVLRDNYLQTQAISVFEAQATELLDQQERFMRLLERAGRLDRSVEFLPADDELARRAHANIGLTRPESAVLLSYAKLWLYDAILDSDLPDDPLLLEDLLRYFPSQLQGEPWRSRMQRHRLKREIIATSATNSMVNRIGGSFIARITERTGTAPADVARAYLVVRDGFGLREVWSEIEALDTLVPASVQTSMLLESNRLVERGIGWVLSHAQRPLDIGRLRTELEPGIVMLQKQLGQILPTASMAALTAKAEDYRAAGVPQALAERVASLIVLASANDISRIAGRVNQPVDLVGRLYFLVTARFGMGWLRAAAERLPGGSHWQKLAVDAVIDDLYARQADLTASVAGSAGHLAADEAMAAWIEQRRGAVERADQLLGELKAAGKLDLATLVVASHQFRGL